MQRLLFPVIWCIFLFPVSGFCLDYYVNGATGSDSATCGQLPTDPCKTIKQALNNIPDGEVTIKIARGTYEEEYLFISTSGSVTKNIVLEGGWDMYFAKHICNFSGTKIVSVYYNDQFRHNLFNVFASESNILTTTIKCMQLFQKYPGDVVRAIDVTSKSNARVRINIDTLKINGFSESDSVISLLTENGGHIDVTIMNSCMDNNYESLIKSAALDSIDDINMTMIDNLITNNGDLSKDSICITLYSREGGSIHSNLINNIIADNLSKYDDAVLFVYSGNSSSISVSLTNDTITNNKSMNDGGVVRIVANDSGKANITMTNSILKKNGDKDIVFQQGTLGDFYDGTITFVADHCMLGNHDIIFGPPDFSSTNEVDGDPALDPSYHLTSGSPAKDAGICGYLTGGGPYQYHRIAPYDDIDGDKRPGWGKLMGCDVGADEYRFPWILFNPATRGTRRP